jgi:hypothetical protein
MGGGRVLRPAFGLLRSPGALAEAEHVGAKGVLSTGSAFVGQEFAVRVYLAFEPLEERLTGRTGTGASVGRSRDFCRDPCVDVLTHVFALVDVPL